MRVFLSFALQVQNKKPIDFLFCCRHNIDIPFVFAFMENIPKRPESREGSAERKVSKDREEKLKYARDRQNEERQRKIEELRAQAEAAQKYREQKEEERRRRIEEIRVRDTEKRHQVEERKKAIIEAEKERREYILKKNQERESRIETKKRDRNSIAFAFGSSTPRLLDVPADYGLVSPSTFWSQRRSTSISNVAGASLSRRSSERELADSGAKKRASSSTDRHDGRAYSMNRLDQLAQPIRRNGEHVRAIVERERRERELEMLDETASLGGGSGRRGHLSRGNSNRRAGSASVGSASGSSTAVGAMSRSMTHLAGGVGQQRERGKYSLGGGISTSFRPLGSTGQRDSSSRSGNVTPGGHGHLSGSRPGSAMSTSTTLSTSGFVPRRPGTASTRKPRPASIAGTGMSLEEINKLKRDQKPPVKTTSASPSTSTAQTTPKRTANLMSTSMIVTSSSTRMHSAEKKTPSKREPLLPKAASASKAQQPSRTASSERISRHAKESINKVPSVMSTSMIVTSTTTTTKSTAESAPATAAPVPKANGVAKEQPEQDAEVPTAEVAAPAVSKAEKEALNTEQAEQEQQELVQLVEAKAQPEPVALEEQPPAEPVVAHVEEKADEGNEKPTQEAAVVAVAKKTSRNGSKENSEVRELTPPTTAPAPVAVAGLAVEGGNDLMTASMIAKKITTEEEAKAALAERRRLAREEAERQAELERQRVEAERLAELKAQEEEAERQRLFEEESTRLAEEQRRGEEERLRKAIEEAQQREEEEQRRREDEERQRIEREEAEKKAKEDAEKQRVEVAERLKREEKEREERRKRVEAIMSRTRKAGAAATPSKESSDAKAVTAAAPKESDSNSSSSNNSTGGSPNSSSSTDAAPVAPVAVAPTAVAVANAPAAPAAVAEPINSQAMYEQSVLDKENSLINSFSNMIIDENAKNLHPFDVSNGKLHVETTTTTITTTGGGAAVVVPPVAVANGNGHIENVNNKNDINLLQDAVNPVAVSQLIDLSIESQQDLHINNNNNNNNNNSLLTSTAATTTLVTADSHENKDISLL
ncbi:ensconsin isoform X5 [Drosophila sulfurigaster albostrigata]|uniref:ensconsin isoform X5 n=1 Tax=Drosophila sulfurigaster albostrigata TaxID=89887 RepID=UPI002D21D6A4|nr:ensconsin isoform X5 [Drosophila sulfurigaster albostrigata]